MKLCYKISMQKLYSNDINIVFSTDENYAKYCTIAITSIKETQKEFDNVNIYILAENLSEKASKRLKKLSDNKFSINLIEFEKLDVTEIKIQEKSLPNPTYYKMLLANLLPDINKILYLDSDVIVRKSLKELWKTDISNYFLAAMPDINEKMVLEQSEITVHKARYFNAGIMLLNIKKWRENNLLERFKSFVKNPTAIAKYSDQCIINYSLKDDEILFLDNRWNFHSEGQVKNVDDIAIIHYVWDKPWDMTAFNPYRKYYWAIVCKTQWRHEIILYTIVNTIALLKRKTFNFTKKIIKKYRNQ